MIYAFLTLLLLGCAFLPQAWVRYVMHKHGKDEPKMPGTGAELARHLIERLDLGEVRVEECGPMQDHYDPASNTARLSPNNYQGKSITAVAVAAHEVGHAIQFARSEPVSRLRGKYIPLSMRMRQIGIYMLLALPVVGFILKAPAAIFAYLAVSVLLQLGGAAMYLVVLPEEWDASFNKALPILEQGEYLPPEQVQKARSVLKAAALTYFAAALADVVNIGRWLLLLRR